jgi:predicted O-methyltransferase YrrM
MRTLVRNFRRGLKMNVDMFNPSQRRCYRWLVRPFLSADERDFFEGIPGITGQMYRAERRALHDAIVRRAPNFSFEIGTFNGGGSTFFSAKAFAKLGRGRLVTLEIDPTLHTAAIDLYSHRLPALRPHVEFVLGGTPALFEPFLRQAGSAEFVLLDGAENAEQSLAQFRFFEPWFRPGSVLAMHDWNTEKMRLVRQLLARSPQWRETLVLADPDSIGFAFYELV